MEATSVRFFVSSVLVWGPPSGLHRGGDLPPSTEAPPQNGENSRRRGGQFVGHSNLRLGRSSRPRSLHGSSPVRLPLLIPSCFGFRPRTVVVRRYSSLTVVSSPVRMRSFTSLRRSATAEGTTGPGIPWSPLLPACESSTHLSSSFDLSWWQ